MTSSPPRGPSPNITTLRGLGFQRMNSVAQTFSLLDSLWQQRRSYSLVPQSSLSSPSVVSQGLVARFPGSNNFSFHIITASLCHVPRQLAWSLGSVLLLQLTVGTPSTHSPFSPLHIFHSCWWHQVPLLLPMAEAKLIPGKLIFCHSLKPTVCINFFLIFNENVLIL